MTAPADSTAVSEAIDQLAAARKADLYHHVPGALLAVPVLPSEPQHLQQGDVAAGPAPLRFYRMRLKDAGTWRDLWVFQRSDEDRKAFIAEQAAAGHIGGLQCPIDGGLAVNLPADAKVPSPGQHDHDAGILECAFGHTWRHVCTAEGCTWMAPIEATP